MSEGWTVEQFAVCALDLTEFDQVLPELVPDHDTLSLRQKSALRAAFKRCQQDTNEASTPAVVESPPGSSSVQGSWTEAFAPKLDQAKIQELKAKFLKDYPSELLNSDTMPSTRLLSLVYHQLQKGYWAWVPWKFRMSVARAEELQTQRASKQPRLEGLALSQLLLDEVPSLEISNHGMGLNAIRNLMDVHSIAIAMCGGAHLANLKEYTHRFMSLLTQKTEASQMADQKTWNIISELLNERKWTMDNALHEVTHIRHDLPSLLQLRPKAPKAHPSAPSSAPSLSKGSKGRGKSSSKGKSKTLSKGKVTWVTEMKSRDGQMKQLCMQWQAGRCTRANCAFTHACAYPMPDGTACGKPHTALEHHKVPH